MHGKYAKEGRLNDLQVDIYNLADLVRISRRAPTHAKLCNNCPYRRRHTLLGAVLPSAALGLVALPPGMSNMLHDVIQTRRPDRLRGGQQAELILHLNHWDPDVVYHGCRPLIAQSNLQHLPAPLHHLDGV